MVSETFHLDLEFILQLFLLQTQDGCGGGDIGGLQKAPTDMVKSRVCCQLDEMFTIGQREVQATSGAN